jgi:hypothetical protein
LHEHVYESPLSVHHFVDNFLADLKIASEQRKKSPTKSPAPSRPGWTPPPAGVVKINVDTAVSKNTGRGSVAVVATDDQGNFVGASATARVFPGRTDAETQEALA